MRSFRILLLDAWILFGGISVLFALQDSNPLYALLRFVTRTRLSEIIWKSAASPIALAHAPLQSFAFTVYVVVSLMSLDAFAHRGR